MFEISECRSAYKLSILNFHISLDYVLFQIKIIPLRFPVFTLDTEFDQTVCFDSPRSSFN
jgi:hypothetical protein